MISCNAILLLSGSLKDPLPLVSLVDILRFQDALFVMCIVIQCTTHSEMYPGCPYLQDSASFTSSNLQRMKQIK